MEEIKAVLVTGMSGMVGKELQDIIGPCKYVRKSMFYDSGPVDLRDYVQCSELFERVRPNIVIHLAAKCGGMFENRSNQKSFFTDNNRMNTNVVNCCAAYKVSRLVTVLSACIYPDVNNSPKTPLPESVLHLGPPHPSNEGYAWSKRMLDKMCEYAEFNTLRLVPVNMFGRFDTSTHMIPELVGKLRSKPDMQPDMLTISGTGVAQRQFMHARDFADFILYVHDNNDVTGLLNVGCAEVYSVKDVVSTLTRVLGVTTQPRFSGNTSDDGQMTRVISFAKLDKLFPGLRSRLSSLEDGVRAVLEI